ncbi:MAG TPA: LCP family protein [Patescibacteria group bacterium]|nr:LCP family protein [Patescibacteria group bacterium]
MKKSDFRKHQLSQPSISTKFVGDDETEQPTSEPQPPKQSKGKRILKWILAIIAVLIVGLGIFVAVRATGLANKIFVGKDTSVFGRLTDLISSQTGGAKLKGESDGQVNVLLLGIGGPGHDGPYLSDTIILAELRPGDKKATLISIPRDYLVNTKEIGQRKINAVFAESYQNSKDWDKAGQSIRDVVSKISGVDIPYFAVLDFKGFEQTVDLLGGVDVTIDRTFTDYSFPDNGIGYLPPVTFKEGQEHMNGERALIFARSRHAAGEEGTDFARSVRQQKIITASKKKVEDLNIVADAGKINQLFTIIGDHFHTNMTPGQMLRAYSLGHELGQDQIVNLSLDEKTGLICPQTLPDSGAFVLTVCPTKTTDDIKNFFHNSFSANKISSEKAVVWLSDSSVTGQLYKKAETKLTNAGLTVYKIVYTGKPLNQSVVYSVNHKTATSDFISSTLNASPVSLPPPGIKIDPAKVDVIVILGGPDAASGTAPSSSTTTNSSTTSNTNKTTNSNTNKTTNSNTNKNTNK